MLKAESKDARARGLNPEEVEFLTAYHVSELRMGVLCTLGATILQHKIIFMKSVLLLVIASTIMLSASAQADKSKRPSPPAQAKETVASGAVISIDYSQPSVKGRTIGKDLEPMNGKVWRTGANEATVFEVSKDVKVEGKNLPAGKYGLFSVVNDGEWTIIFSKTWNQWGTRYSEADDVLRVKAKAGKAKEFAEKLSFTISKAGVVSILWGDNQVDFKVE